MTPLTLLCNNILLCLVVAFNLGSVQSYQSTPPPPGWRPSTNKATILDITSPDELMDFVLKDDRPAIIKVYSNWCKTCKQFDMRYKKVASIWGEKAGGGGFSNRARFAQMEYSRNEDLCKLLKATKLPYILIYTRDEGEVAGFTCPPSQVQRLIDALHEHAPPLNDDDLPLMMFTDEVTFETLLENGSDMMDAMMPEIQKEAGYEALSFEEFCKKHTSKKKID